MFDTMYSSFDAVKIYRKKGTKKLQKMIFHFLQLFVLSILLIISVAMMALSVVSISVFCTVVAILVVMLLFCFALTDIIIHFPHGHVFTVFYGDSVIISL